MIDTTTDEGAAQPDAAAPKKTRKRASKDAATTDTAAAPEAPKAPIVHEDIQAPYKFTTEEVAQMNVNLRMHLDNIESLEDQKKSAVQDFTLRITNHKNDVKMLRNKLNAGEESRPLKALVEFDVPRSKKKFVHPQTGEVIREENMTPADWQLPMFKPLPDGTEKLAERGEQDVPQKPPAAAPAKKGSKPAGDPAANAGTTPVDAVLTKAASDTTPALLPLDLTIDYTHNGLTKAFKTVATEAGWNVTQIGVIAQQLKLADSVERMLDILRPHTRTPEVEELNPLG